MSKTIYFIIIFTLTLSFCNVATAAPTCREKYLDSLAQCDFNCSNLGSDYNADNAIGLCDIGQVCCHKTASSSGIAQSLELQIPLFDYALAANFPEYILSVYRYTMIVVVPLAIIMIIIGGIFWISAAGAKEKIAKAKSYIINAFIGLGLALFSYIFLSLVGIENLRMPGLQKIEPIIVNSETLDMPCDENNPTEPRCQPPAQSTTKLFYDIFLHSAYAKADVPLIKQADYNDLNFGACGTISTSGCGIAALTMILQFLGIGASISGVTQMAVDMEARDCPPSLPSSCKTDTTNVKNNCNCCNGTRYNIFLTTANDSLMKKYNKISDTKNYTSQILKTFGLKGESVSYNDKKTILSYLSAQIPLIVSVKGPSRFTSTGHILVLTGCDNCLSALDSTGKQLINSNSVIYLNDPHNNITSTTTGEILPLLQAVFYIHDTANNNDYPTVL
jgi:hypothetical protein